MAHYNLKHIENLEDESKVLRSLFDNRKNVAITYKDIMRQSGVGDYRKFIGVIERLENLCLISQPSEGYYTVSDWLYGRTDEI